MGKLFESADSAVDFLRSEAAAAERFQQDRQALYSHARTTLRRKGAFILGIDGRYSGSAGPMGSSYPGALIVQGTEPVRIGTSYWALRDAPEEDRPEIELVSTGSGGKAYMESVRPVDILAKIGATNLHHPGVEEVDVRHVVATKMVVDVISEGLEEVIEPDQREFGLPRVTNALDVPFPTGQVFDIRTDEISPSHVLYR